MTSMFGSPNHFVSIASTPGHILVVSDPTFLSVKQQGLQRETAVEEAPRNEETIQEVT